MKNKVLNIVEIALSAITFPLWFIKMFVGSGHLPNQEGEIVEVIFRHSMYENICDGFHPMLAYISTAMIIASVILNIVALKFPNNKRLKTICNIVFGVAIGLFIILLLLASTVARGY